MENSNLLDFKVMFGKLRTWNSKFQDLYLFEIWILTFSPSGGRSLPRIFRMFFSRPRKSSLADSSCASNLSDPQITSLIFVVLFWVITGIVQFKKGVKFDAKNSLAFFDSMTHYFRFLTTVETNCKCVCVLHPLPFKKRKVFFSHNNKATWWAEEQTIFEKNLNFRGGKM